MKKRKILLVLTGGTICSEVKDGLKSQTSDNYALIDNFIKSNSPYVDIVEIKPTDNYQIFSENMSINMWQHLIDMLRSSKEILGTARKYGKYPRIPNQEQGETIFDGVIIAHGTDSLAYSSSLFSILLKGLGVPVFFVASNEALCIDRANGNENFRAAIECMCLGIKPGVYVTYKNISDNKMYLHHAARLKQCCNYEEDFYSSGMIDISNINDVNCQRMFDEFFSESQTNKNLYESEFVFNLFGDWQLKNSILKIEPYVGIDYENYNYDNFDTILHGAYHSGTVCTVITKNEADEKKYDLDDEIKKDSVLYLLKKCNARINTKKENGDNTESYMIYISPALGEGLLYDTIIVVANTAKRYYPNCLVRFVYGCTMEMLYSKILLAKSSPEQVESIDDFIEREYNCEIVHESKEKGIIVFKCESN